MHNQTPRHREGFTPRHRDENRFEDAFTLAPIGEWLFIAPRHRAEVTR